jgi:4-alpha-glucanotransferase
MACHHFFNDTQWSQWPTDIKFRYPNALTYYGEKLATEILRLKFGQYLFFNELNALEDYLRKHNLGLIGDLAFYVNHDSADVWSNPQLFCLDGDGESAIVAGVQPDYYSKTGQLWGNPVYNWPQHQNQNYNWWRSRILHNLSHFDWVRLDHFRAFAAFWSVARGMKDAMIGSWRPGPGIALFDTLGGISPRNIISEDLGLITPDVTQLRKTLDYPGMRVLQFGAGDPTGLSIHCPFRIEPDNAVYTSTHDTDTAKGWFIHELTDDQKLAITRLAGFDVDESNIAWTLIHMAWFSPASIAITTVQDLLNLSSSSRVNIPGTSPGNWTWRLTDFTSITDELKRRLKTLSEVSGRDNYQHPNLLHY